MKKKSRPQKVRQPFDIFIVGLGIMGVRHLTREAEEVIKASKHVFFVDAGFGVGEHLKSICPRASSLLSSYVLGENRIKAYRNMAATVVDAALREPPVCFAAYGHPTMFVHPTSLIRKAAAYLKLKVQILPGISALDTAIIDLEFDPGIQGLQIYEATDILIKERPLQADVPCLLFQVHALETGLFAQGRSNAKRFVRLQQYLLRYYPSKHKIVSVLSSTFPLVQSVVDAFPLSDFPKRYSKGSQSGTLYIPPVKMRRIANRSLLKDINSPAHLREITKQMTGV